MALIVRLEIDSASTGAVRQIGVLKITHTEDVSDPEIGNYIFALKGDAFIQDGKIRASVIDRMGHVEKHERLKKPAWALVLHALSNSLPEHTREHAALNEARAEIIKLRAQLAASERNAQALVDQRDLYISSAHRDKE